MEPTERNYERSKTSETSKTSWPAWLAQRMVKTLEMYANCNLSKEGKAAHLREWEIILREVGPAAFDRALSDHIRTSEFFPTVAKLRERACIGGELPSQLEAEAAWQLVERDLADASKHAGPHLSDRVEYAISCAGGRLGINACFSASVTDEAFCKKRFVEAFANYDAAEHLGLHRLDSSVHQLLAAGVDDRLRLKLVSGSKQSSPAPTWKPPVKLKQMPRQLSDDEVEARRALLAEQARELGRRGDRR